MEIKFRVKLGVAVFSDRPRNITLLPSFAIFIASCCILIPLVSSHPPLVQLEVSKVKAFFLSLKQQINKIHMFRSMDMEKKCINFYNIILFVTPQTYRM